LGWSHCLLGELATAKECIEKGISLHRQAGMPYFMSLHLMLAAMVDLDSGNLASAKDNIEQGLRLSKQAGEKWVEAMSLVFLGRILAKSDRSLSDQAKEYVREGIRMLKGLNVLPLCSQAYLIMAEVLLNDGKRLKALGNLLRAKRMFKTMHMDYWLALTKKPV